MSKNKIIYMIIAIIIIIIIGGGIYWGMQKTNSFISTPDSTSDSNMPANTETQNDTAEKINPLPSNNTTSSNNTTPSNSSLSYTNALKIYVDRRIQFSINSSNYCTMNPYTIAFRKGTNAMFDNRANKQITIYLDGKPYYIKAYGFKIITLTTSATLPHTIKVDCGTGKNNGTIILR